MKNIGASKNLNINQFGKAKSRGKIVYPSYQSQIQDNFQQRQYFRSPEVQYNEQRKEPQFNTEALNKGNIDMKLVENVIDKKIRAFKEQIIQFYSNSINQVFQQMKEQVSQLSQQQNQKRSDYINYNVNNNNNEFNNNINSKKNYEDKRGGNNVPPYSKPIFNFCNLCYASIKSSYVCANCSDYIICQDCYNNKDYKNSNNSHSKHIFFLANGDEPKFNDEVEIEPISDENIEFELNSEKPVYTLIIKNVGEVPLPKLYFIHTKNSLKSKNLKVTKEPVPPGSKISVQICLEPLEETGEFPIEIEVRNLENGYKVCDNIILLVTVK